MRCVLKEEARRLMPCTSYPLLRSNCARYAPSCPVTPVINARLGCDISVGIIRRELPAARPRDGKTSPGKPARPRADIASYGRHSGALAIFAGLPAHERNRDVSDSAHTANLPPSHAAVRAASDPGALRIPFWDAQSVLPEHIYKGPGAGSICWSGCGS